MTTQGYRSSRLGTISCPLDGFVYGLARGRAERSTLGHLDGPHADRVIEFEAASEMRQEIESVLVSGLGRH